MHTSTGHSGRATTPTCSNTRSSTKAPVQPVSTSKSYVLMVPSSSATHAPHAAIILSLPTTPLREHAPYGSSNTGSTTTSGRNTPYQFSTIAKSSSTLIHATKRRPASCPNYGVKCIRPSSARSDAGEEMNPPRPPQIHIVLCTNHTLHG